MTQTFRSLEPHEFVRFGDEWCLSWMLETDPDGCWCPVDTFVGQPAGSLKAQNVVVRRCVSTETVP